MRFTLIKHKPGKTGLTKIKFSSEDAESKTHAETEYVSEDDPAPEFVKAFEALRPDVIGLLGLPKDWEGQLVVHTIQLKHKDGGRWGVIINAYRKLDSNNKPFNITVPEFQQPADGHTYGKKGVLSQDLEEKVLAIIGYADDFRKGTRAQQSLELADQEEEDREQTDLEEAIDEAEEEPAGKAPEQSPAVETVEIFRDGQRRPVTAGKTLVVVGSAGIHSGDHLRVLTVDKKQVTVAKWDDEGHEPIGVIQLDDLGWSQRHDGFLTLHVDWLEEEDAPGPLDELEEEDATAASA